MEAEVSLLLCFRLTSNRLADEIIAIRRTERRSPRPRTRKASKDNFD
jgi:hypothetical protein